MKSLLVAVCIALFCSAAIGGPKEDALLVVNKWAKAFGESDVDGVTRLFASDAIFLGTVSKSVMATPEEIRKYFEQAFLVNKPPRSAALDSYSALALSDTVVVVTGLDTLTGVRDGTPTTNHGRVTFVIAKRGPEWQIAHFHRSALPN